MKPVTTWITFLLIILGLAQTALAHDASTQAQFRAREEEDIYEAVLRYWWWREPSRPTLPTSEQKEKKGPSPRFIRVKGKDPRPAFLQRFAGAGATIKAASASESKTPSGLASVLRDRVTGQHGTLYSLHHFQWRNWRRVRLGAFMTSGPLSGSGWAISVYKQDNLWRVDGMRHTLRE